MDIRKVKKLIELLEESNIGEIEIKEGEESVRISRHGNQPAAPVAYAAPALVAPAPAPAPVAAAAAPVVNDGRIVASPRAKKLASQMGVDLATVRGSGPHGRIQAEDVEKAGGQPISVPRVAEGTAPAGSGSAASAAAAPAAEASMALLVPSIAGQEAGPCEAGRL